MKEQLLEIIKNDTSYSKSAFRYLHKTNPKLWLEICKNTSFLPNTAKPKQRVWHILNDINEIPKCPVTGNEVKWWENRYLKTYDKSASATHLNKNNLLKNQTSEANNKRKNTIKESYEQGSRTYKVHSRLNAKKALKSTCLKKYGVDNPSKTKSSRRKISEARIKNGATPWHERSMRRIYYDIVWQVTETSWRENFIKINPNRIDRSKNALDHIYSIQQGFRDGIPPYILGHWTNLRIITLVENSKKGMKCDKTKEELFNDFYKEIKL